MTPQLDALRAGTIGTGVLPDGRRAGVSVAPASTLRIRLKGLAFRRIDPGTARPRVAVARRRGNRTPRVPGRSRRPAARGDQPGRTVRALADRRERRQCSGRTGCLLMIETRLNALMVTATQITAAV